MGKPKNNVENLLAAIKQKVPPKREPVKVAEPEPKSPEKKKGGTGSGAQFWLQDDDRKLIREAYAWLAGQGIRPTDTLIVRAALRIAKPGQELLDACRSLSKKSTSD